jgi:glucose/mannose transport system permease protein
MLAPITLAAMIILGHISLKIFDLIFAMAGALLAALPTLLVDILLGRYFIRGLLAGSVKG